MGFPYGSAGKNLPESEEIQETWIQSLGQKDPLDEGMATHSSILAQETPQTGKPGELLFTESDTTEAT